MDGVYSVNMDSVANADGKKAFKPFSLRTSADVARLVRIPAFSSIECENSVGFRWESTTEEILTENGRMRVYDSKEHSSWIENNEKQNESRDALPVKT